MENKIRRQRNKSNCPNIEAIACYVDGILPEKKRQALEAHIALCKSCGESIKVQKAVAGSQKQEGLMLAPNYVTKRAKDLVNKQIGANVLELFIKFTDKAIEVVRTTGDVLSGGQLQPAYVLRGKDTKLTSTQSIIKVFDNIKVEIEVSRQREELNKLILKVKDDQTETPINDLRATLIEKSIELESYITQNGKAIFENIKPGKYSIRISKVRNPIGVIALELNKE